MRSLIDENLSLLFDGCWCDGVKCRVTTEHVKKSTIIGSGYLITDHIHVWMSSICKLMMLLLHLLLFSSHSFFFSLFCFQKEAVSVEKLPSENVPAKHLSFWNWLCVEKTLFFPFWKRLIFLPLVAYLWVISVGFA